MDNLTGLINIVKRGAPLTNDTRFSVGRISSGAGDGCVPLHALGNPFPLKRESQRLKVIQDYAAWLLEQIKLSNRAVCDALNVLVRVARKGKIELECFCAPRLCHAEVIRLLVLTVLEREVWEREDLISTLEERLLDVPSELHRIRESLLPATV